MSYISQRSYPRKKDSTAGMVIGGCLGAIVLAIAGDFLFAWVLMLVMDGLNAFVSPAIPAVGFWGAFVVVIAVSVVGTIFRGMSNSKGNN